VWFVITKFQDHGFNIVDFQTSLTYELDGAPPAVTMDVFKTHPRTKDNQIKIAVGELLLLLKPALESETRMPVAAPVAASQPAAAVSSSGSESPENSKAAERGGAAVTGTLPSKTDAEVAKEVAENGELERTSIAANGAAAGAVGA